MSPYDKLTAAMGGKSHFLLAVSLILVTVAFYTMGNSPAFTVYVGFVSLACGLQHRRSIKEDEIGNTDIPEPSPHP